MELNSACWLGGTSCSGKTTISENFECDNIQVFHTDDIFIKRPVTEESQPYIWRLRNEGWDSIMRKSLDECTDIWMHIYKEAFEIVKSDILQLKTSDKVIVEGICLLPELLIENNIRNACYLICTPEFFNQMLDKKSQFQNELHAKREASLIDKNIRDMLVRIRTYINESVVKSGYTKGFI